MEKTLDEMAAERCETAEDAVVEIQNRVYEATALFERLEFLGKVRGNGHHIRQEAARLIGELMKERWEGK